MELRAGLDRRNLHTVCEEARCPNIGQCWSSGTATIMIMGDVCTRSCRFCAVHSGHPGGMLDHSEPVRVAKAVYEWGLAYVVLTSVCRDDLPDGGARHFAQTINSIRDRRPGTLVEALIPDFGGRIQDIRTVVEAGPDVIGHNVETVRCLTPRVRDCRASYDQSLSVLKTVQRLDAEIHTKSSIMLGLGETEDEVTQTMLDLRSAGVSILTIGQYLRPSPKHLDVAEYVLPTVFDSFRMIGEDMGFLYVASGPMVRSSYHAGEYFIKNIGSPTAAATEAC